MSRLPNPHSSQRNYQLGNEPGGQEVQEIRTPSKAQLEFQPNRPDQVHRVLDSSKMRIIYGDHSNVDTFMGWNVATRTDKPPTPGQTKAPAPSYTWSDEMIAKFSRTRVPSTISNSAAISATRKPIGKLPPKGCSRTKRCNRTDRS